MVESWNKSAPSAVACSQLRRKSVCFLVLGFPPDVRTLFGLPRALREAQFCVATLRANGVAGAAVGLFANGICSDEYLWERGRLRECLNLMSRN